MSKNQEDLLKGKDRLWIFTLFNYDVSDLKNLQNIECNLTGRVRAIEYQSEICPKTQKKHLQGLILFNLPARPKMVKKILCRNDVHIERMENSLKANIKYTSKSESYDSETNIFVARGIFDLTRGKTLKTSSSTAIIVEKLVNGDPLEIAIKGNELGFATHFHGIKEVAIMYKKIDPKLVEEMKEIQYKEWQQDLHDILEKKPDRRSVYWVYEEKGHVGKSQFIEKYCVEHENDSYSLDDIGNRKDATDGLRNWMDTYKTPRVILIDLARSHDRSDLNLYRFIESLKNRRMTCTKYKGEFRVFNTLHVMIFANWLPLFEIENGGIKGPVLSEDRWRIYTIKNNKLIKITLEEAKKQKEIEISESNKNKN